MIQKPLSIAILADMPRGAVGGKSLGRGGKHAATWLPQLAEALSRESDFKITWLTLDKEVKTLEVDEALGQRFFRIPRGKMTWDIIFNHRFARKKLKAILKEVAPDIVHVWGSESSYPSILKGVKIPSIMSMQGILSHYFKIGALPGGWRARRQASYEAPWIKAATFVTSESQWGLDKVKEIHPLARIKMVEYGVHPSFYDLSWKPDVAEPVLFFCGSIEWRKGVDVLVEALRQIPSRSWVCKIAGEGALRSTLEAKGVKNIEWLGNLRWDQLQDQLCKSWALVLPTRADTSPNVVKEARVIGLPVITTRSGGQEGYIKDGENGWIVDPLSVENLKTAMESVMSNFEVVKERGATNHTEDQQYFLPEKTAQGFADLYRELARAV